MKTLRIVAILLALALSCYPQGAGVSVNPANGNILYPPILLFDAGDTLTINPAGTINLDGNINASSLATFNINNWRAGYFAAGTGGYTFTADFTALIYYEAGSSELRLALGADAIAITSGGSVEIRAGFDLAGSASGLTGLNATQLTFGTVPVARLNSYEPVDFFDTQNPKLKGFKTTEDRGRSLVSMQLQRTLTALGVTNGVSGATFNQRTGTIFIVVNQSAGAGFSYELSQDGQLLRTITHSNFNDTECIEWIGSIIGAGTGTLYDVFAIGEEDESTAGTTNPGLQRITLCLLTPGATTLDRTATNGTDPDNVTSNTVYAGGNIDNNGLESIAYDARHNLLYYTAEFRTDATNVNQTGTGAANIYQRTITVNGSSLSFVGGSTITCSVLSLFSGTLTDIGDIAYDYMTDTILLLSDQSDKVVRINRTTGTVIEQLSTPANQPEGLAISPDGRTIWVTGENQEFYRYGIGDGMEQLLASQTYPSTTSSINVQTGTSYTLVAGDNGKIITMNNAGAITLTIPTGLPDGFNCRVVQLGAGTVTATASGTTVNGLGGALASPGQYGALWIQERADAANSFVVVKLNQ